MTLQSHGRSSASPLLLRLLPVFFFFSGASSLVFETVFTRLLTYTFGNTAHAVSTVLAAFLGGLALGAYVLGRWVDRRGASVWIYGTLELFVGIYCFFVPQLFALITRAYVALYQLLHLGGWSLNAVRFALAGAVILVPTVLMGGTLPVLARCVAAAGGELQREVDRLYAWNTLGAAVGTLASTYLLMPMLGVRGTINMACGANLAIFLGIAAWASRRPQPLPDQSAPVSRAALENVSGSAEKNPRAVLIVGAFLTGFVALGYEVVWTHVLSFLVGNTVYAFGTMLFTFLCGLGLGAWFVAHRLTSSETWARALAGSQLLLGLVIFLTLPLWNRIPDVFAQGLEHAPEFDVLGLALLLVVRIGYVGWKIYRRPLLVSLPWGRIVELLLEVLLLGGLLSGKLAAFWNFDATPFVAGELLRFFCAFYLLIIPCLLLGLNFPLLLNLATRMARGVGSSVGEVYAANTLGTVLGSIATGFAALPALGSLVTLRVAGTLNLLLGCGFAFLLVPMRSSRKLVLGVVAASLAVLFWQGPVQWDARQMTRGSDVYFDRGWAAERVLFFQEDVQGGLTSVIQQGPYRTMLSNGKFQGNNWGETTEQARFALIPILFTQNFDRALVIGLGTGHTLRVVSRFPFREIDAVEIAPRIVDAARQWFQDVNDDVFDRDPRVKLSIADGRNFLLLSRARYDLITIEISSIWISGEADLYNREFYELCAVHLGERGVLQQWVQLHHMRPQDLLVTLNTAARVFPHVAFFLGAEQGVLIASPGPLEGDYSRLATFDSDPEVRHELDLLKRPSLFSLLGEIVLDDASFRQAVALLPRLSGLRADFVSSDDRPYLEYQTPKGNALRYDAADLNTRFLRKFTPPALPADVPVRNLPSQSERNLVLGYALEARGDTGGALEAFRRVEGPAQTRAQVEIARLAASAYPGSP